MTMCTDDRLKEKLTTDGRGRRSRVQRNRNISRKGAKAAKERKFRGVRARRTVSQKEVRATRAVKYLVTVRVVTVGNESMSVCVI